jgi:hypothetical protein
MREHTCDSVPTCLSMAPCSGSSRRGLETPVSEASQVRRPALTTPARGAPQQAQVGTKERPHGTNKGTEQRRKPEMT